MCQHKSKNPLNHFKKMKVNFLVLLTKFFSVITFFLFWNQAQKKKKVRILYWGQQAITNSHELESLDTNLKEGWRFCEKNGFLKV